MSRLFAVRRSGEASAHGPLLWALLPLVLAAISWCVQETPYWDDITGVVFVILAICLGVGVKIAMAGVKFTRGIVLGYLSLVLSFGAWVLAGKADPVTEVTCTSDLKTPVRIYYQDELLHTLDQPGVHHFRRRRFDATQARMELLLPDGWGSVPLKIEHSPNEYLGEKWTRLAVDRTQRPLREIGLWVDNRAQPPLELQCGQWQCTVPANQKSAIYLYEPSASAARPLSVNGRQVGVLTANHWLLDATAQRSYRIRSIQYGNSVMVLRGTTEQLTRAQTLHPLPAPVDYFLEAAPQTIKVHPLEGASGTRRIEVTEAP